ncbi:chloride channel protein [Chthoniobacter flavus]|uniref:chloride channel protein n=1 Tax=Chthoniobacter flavus TaxID=191863 RepID=UPI00192C6567|nr:chloride channel protein [Chthoniobacter flavus]
MFTAVLYGLAASLVAVAFQVAINKIYWASFIYPLAKAPQLFPWISFAVITVVSIISGWLLANLCPEAAGSGIPQLKLAFWKDFGHTSSRVGWVKFIASSLSIGGGMSLGREGPSVQLGGNVSSIIAGFLGVAKQNKRTAAAAGAAAGLAAAFNAPLAAVAFVLEEILEDLNSRLLGPVLLASVIGAFIVHAFLGAQPAFDLPRIDEPTWRAYLLMPFSAVLAALSGVIFQRGSLALRARSRTWRQLPAMWRPLLAGWITWGLGMAVYARSGHLGVFALGYDDLSAALTGGIFWKLALALLVAKLIATISCYGLGGCGGVFSPSLFFGGMCGVAVAGLGNHFLALNEADRTLLAVVGMSACLGGVVQAPVTSVLIIFEMTHQFALVPGLLIAALVSQIVARRCNHENFYEAILTQDGHDMAHVVPPRDLRSWQNLPISAIAHFEPAVISGLEETTCAAILEKTPYQRYPVATNGKLEGILLRSDFEAAQKEKRPVGLVPAVTARPSQTIRQCQVLLIESTCGLIVITDTEGGRPLAVVTLHDLLRAQAAISEREG